MKAAAAEVYSKAKVYGFLFLGLTSFSLAPILVRFAGDYSALLVAAVRTVIAVGILLPVFIQKKGAGSFNPKKLSKEHWWVLFAGVSLGLHFIFWIASVYYTSVASASVLVCIHPIILIVAERWLFKVKFRAIVWAGVVIAFIGTMFLGYFDMAEGSTSPNAFLGNSFAVTAAFIFAVYFLIGRKVRQKRDWISYVFPVYGYAAATCVIVLFSIEGFRHQLDQTVLLVGLGLAVGPQILGHGSLNYAVKFVSPTLLSTLILMEPLFASIIAFFLFKELPVIGSIIAMAVILLGISLTWKRKKT